MLPDVKIDRQDNQLDRVAPVDDRVIGLILSGVAVAGKIALAEPKQIFSTDELPALGITQAENAFAYAEILDYYAKAGQGSELNFMLVSEATLLADICDAAQDIARKLLDFAGGRITHLLVNRKLPVGYAVVPLEGLDADVWNAATKLEALALEYDNGNKPFVGILPGIGFTKATIASLRDVGTMTTARVAAPVLGAADNTGRAAIGVIAGWVVKNAINYNIGRVASGAVLDAAFFTDGTSVNEYSDGTLGSIHDKRYIFFRKIYNKSGFFFNDDPTAVAGSSDFSSISWNSVINKAKRLAYGVLIDHLNDDVDTDETTGNISIGVASDWEGDVERTIRIAMVNTKQITAVKCTVDPNATDIANDKISAILKIVRKGQAKEINVKIGFAVTI